MSRLLQRIYFGFGLGLAVSTAWRISFSHHPVHAAWVTVRTYGQALVIFVAVVGVIALVQTVRHDTDLRRFLRRRWR